MTDNQYYRGLNLRFDRRCRLLTKLGWTYKQLPVEGLTLAGFTKQYGRLRAITASCVLYANNRAWRDILAHNLRRA